ncbi:MAG: acetylornithine transaminase [Actinomycetota bacterium]|nr:acetylornithine transaminase [Actinomycetota bacterium]
MNTYARLPILFERGEGSYLFDVEGKRYIDFLSGLGVSSVGHSHPKVVSAIKAQAEKLIHTSNLFYTSPQIELAKKIVGLSFADKVFFANSGAEANEGAVKLARKYSKAKKGEGCYEIITALRSFHGRTMKMLAATGQPDKQRPFEPMPVGFKHIPLNEIETLRSTISEKTCAIMLEPIQGEGGVYPCDKDYLKAIRRLCDESGLILIFDEVQTGIGRTGEMFAYEFYGIEPDIMTLAKGLGGGLPIGALLAKDEFSRAFSPGDHGSTFGGNLLVCAAALAVLEVIDKEDLLTNCKNMSVKIMKRLEAMPKSSGITEIRGTGLMIGIELASPGAKAAVKSALSKGLIINAIGDRIIRFLPPLSIGEKEIDLAMDIFEDVIMSRSGKEEMI